MALREWASLARLDKLKLIPRGACFSLPAGRKPGQSLRVTKAMNSTCDVLQAVSAEFWTHYTRRWTESRYGVRRRRLGGPYQLVAAKVPGVLPAASIPVRS